MERTVPDGTYGLLGQSAEICKVRHTIEKLSRSRTPALLLGETGTGKEVAARAIHTANPVGDFIPIDCGALVGPLMESELFGHTRGAFTGAAEAKKGLIEVANGGTVFFDEIGDLPLDMQVKLLRLLQEHEIRAVGSVRQQKVDIRVIAATHHDLARDVAREIFRADLYYRLKVAIVHLPSLRDRREDIPLLIEHFIARAEREIQLGEDAREVMLNYPWPGNVRELQNAIERMVALNSGAELHVPDLPTALQNFAAGIVAPLASAAAAGAETGPLPLMHSRPHNELFLPEMEKQTILRALDVMHGDRTKAAGKLGIGRTTLYRKLKEYKIEN